jgi:hypothetical protein
MTFEASVPLVRHLACVAGPPPYIHRQAKVHSFPMHVDRDRLQALCDAWFEVPSRGSVRYRALLPYVFILVAHIGEISASNPAKGPSGRTSEIDLGLWTLVARIAPFSIVPRWLPLRLLVDSSAAVVVGREVYGFQKELGVLEVPGQAPCNGPFVAIGLVTPNEGDMTCWQEVIRVESVGQSSSAGSQEWKSLDEANDAWREWLAPRLEHRQMSRENNEIMLAAAMLQLPAFAFLKQIMTADGRDNACYQAVLEGHASLLAFRGGGLNTDRFRARVNSYYSHPFQSVLGITSGAWHDVGHGIWSDFDFAMNDASVLFEAR